MKTPIVDFLQEYAAASRTRLHMPGHKGRGVLGCEELDITEVKGADALYEADGIIAESEANATALFGSARTCYSAEGSSQCIRAMLYLLEKHRPAGTAPLVLAARNVHKAFVYAAALLDLDVEWLWPDMSDSLCSCRITPQQLEAALQAQPYPPLAVYITSPDYLGGVADIAALAEVCHAHGTYLAVDNAHGAYLHFLPEAQHPLDLGADICCDSAHKTLPVLTGGAYLHISRRAAHLAADAKQALALFGSTSPSYLIMASLDNCNRYLAEDFRPTLANLLPVIEAAQATLRQAGWQVESSDPLRITVRAPHGSSGFDLAEKLREQGIEPEYADEEHLVLMISTQNTPQEVQLAVAALGVNSQPYADRPTLPQARGEQQLSIREALFPRSEVVAVDEALGRICGAPAVSCPPAIPIAISGEEIGAAAIALFKHYGIESVEVVK